MKRPLVCTLGALALSSMLLAAGPATADPPDHAKGWKQARYDVDDWHDRDRRDDDDRYRRDDRHDRRDRYDDGDHRHYDRHHHVRHYPYPPRGYVVTRLPPGYREVRHHGARYYYDRGAWYRPYGSRFIVVAPPIGLTIPFRPDLYATLWFGGVP